jgi:hypothetical protein
MKRSDRQVLEDEMGDKSPDMNKNENRKSSGPPATSPLQELDV